MHFSKNFLPSPIKYGSVFFSKRHFLWGNVTVGHRTIRLVQDVNTPEQILRLQFEMLHRIKIHKKSTTYQMRKKGSASSAPVASLFCIKI